MRRVPQPRVESKSNIQTQTTNTPFHTNNKQSRRQATCTHNKQHSNTQTRTSIIPEQHWTRLPHKQHRERDTVHSTPLSRHHPLAGSSTHTHDTHNRQYIQNRRTQPTSVSHLSLPGPLGSYNRPTRFHSTARTAHTEPTTAITSHTEPTTTTTTTVATTKRKAIAATHATHRRLTERWWSGGGRREAVEWRGVGSVDRYRREVEAATSAASGRCGGSKG